MSFHRVETRLHVVPRIHVHERIERAGHEVEGALNRKSRISPRMRVSWSRRALGNLRLSSSARSNMVPDPCRQQWPRLEPLSERSVRFQQRVREQETQSQHTDD